MIYWIMPAFVFAFWGALYRPRIAAVLVGVLLGNALVITTSGVWPEYLELLGVKS